MQGTDAAASDAFPHKRKRPGLDNWAQAEEEEEGGWNAKRIKGSESLA